MHRTLSKAVSQALKEGQERLLWRLEPTRSHEAPTVLVQTLTKPNWDVLEEDYAEIYPPKAFQPAFRRGQSFHFRLLANPVKRLRETGKRKALKTPEEKLAWLEKRLGEGGFRLAEENGLRAVRILRDYFLEIPTCREGKESQRMQIQVVLFEGQLVVEEPEKARETLERGIGPGKAIGLGLLSLKP